MTTAITKPETGPGTDPAIRLGRVALGTQGVLYVVLGLLAVQVARGRHGVDPSQKGAIKNLAHQPFGRVLVALLALGLLAHFGWRLLLAVRGEPGDDEDGQSVAKRVANLARAAVYASFTFAAVKLVLGTGGGGDSQTEQKSTSTALGWPGGRILVVIAGLCVVGSGVWNGYKAVARKFEDSLDLSGLDEAKAHEVRAVGIAGYLARGVAFALIGWFLVQAGLDKNSGKTKGLDGALRSLADSGNGRFALFVVALGLVLFGAFRILDGVYRKPSEIAHS